jgi:mitochondrial fission protein ELM1
MAVGGNSGEVGRVPRVWLLVGDREGDNRQVETLAGSLEWPFQRKYLCARAIHAATKPRVVSSLHHLDLDRSDPLEPPWPDLVITMGRRLSMASLWIRDRSDGRAKLVLVGKPSGRLDDFDLIVASAENPLPRRPNVMPVGLPLLRLDESQLRDAEKKWASRLAALQRPLIALLVGGPTKPFLFDSDDAEQMIDRVARAATDAGGSLFVTTSPRTPAAFTEILRRRLPAAGALHCWTPDSDSNPYLGVLAGADEFVVTADSISMLAEVAQIGKPLAIYPLRVGKPRIRTRFARRLAGRILSSTADERAIRALQPLGYALYRAGLIRHARNFSAIHDVLVRDGLAVHFGQGLATGGREARDELKQVVARIEQLVDRHP